MPPSIIALETLRQAIEAALQESGSLADYLDHGRPSFTAQRDTEHKIGELNAYAAAAQRDLQNLCAQVPEAVSAWAALHITALLPIAGEPPTNAHTRARQMLAHQTIQEWERVRAGLQTYVAINRYYLADHQEAMRRLLPVLPC
jgi:hypothetical protein